MLQSIQKISMSESESASHCRKNGEGQQIKMNKKMKFVRINTISWPFPRRAGETRGKTEADKSNPFYCAHKNEEQKNVRFLSVSQHEQENKYFHQWKLHSRKSVGSESTPRFTRERNLVVAGKSSPMNFSLRFSKSSKNLSWERREKVFGFSGLLTRENYEHSA